MATKMEMMFAPPSPFLALPGEPPVPWPRWYESFQNYILALGLKDVSDARMKAILLHCLGTEGQRIFHTLGVADKYADCVALLNGYFAAPQSVILRRILFRQRRQQVGESVHHYAADLRGLASVCDFGRLQDELIRDQLAEHTNNPRVREKLIMSPDGLTLSKAVEIAFQIESAAALATQLSATPPPLPQFTAQQIECPPAPPTPPPPDDAHQVNYTARQQHPSQRCGNCGSSSHATRAQNCPARGQRCQNCGKQNHFARVCRSAPANTQRQTSSADSRLPPTTIHTVSAPHRSFKTCTVELDGVCLPLLLDTGADASLLNAATVKRFFPHHALSAPPPGPIRGYANSKIDIVGTVSFTVRYGDKTVPSFTFKVARLGTNLMGLDLLAGLGFELVDYSGLTIHHVTSPWPQQWPELFSGLGCLSAFNHQPLLNPKVRPVIQPLRRVPLALRDEVAGELKNLLEDGVIEPINASPWISNLVVSRKKTGGLRLCIDLKAVNKAVIPDKYPLPTPEELTTQFHASTMFTKLDLRQGYLQIPLHPDSRNLTAFVTHVGVFRYTRMPFGLSSAPSCFQKIMATVFAGIPGVAIYLDDIVVHGPTPSVHDERLRQVLGVLASHNLRLNGDKCVFAASEIEYLGFRVSAKGLQPLQCNVEAVLRLPEPSCPAQVASFLGMTAYYLRFMPQYSATTAPLRELLKKGAPWVWSAACSNAVQRLKVQLTSPPVLAHFDPTCPTLLTCDASSAAVGAVLSQLHDGVERPVAFASRALSDAEQKYSVGEREALACIWASERWHMYLYGRPYTLRTDHQALTALLATSGAGHRPLRLHRWSERLQQYNYSLQFTPGRENVVADLLSRATPCSSPDPDPGPDVAETALIHMLHSPLQSTVSLRDLQEASEQDPVLSQLRTFIRTGWPSKIPEELVPFHRVREELSCWNDVCVARGVCTVIPDSLRTRVLTMAHEGHLGIVRVKQRCRDRVWWPGIDRDIEASVKDCTACLLSGKTGPPAPPPLQPLHWPARPWEHLQLDICGELQGVPHHQRFLLVVYDLHSKWPEVLPTGSVTTRVVTDFLDSLFARWGFPTAITTDNGPQFISAEFAAFMEERGVKHIRTAFYHPEANGGVERLNQTLKNGIRAHLADNFTFPAALLRTLLHYRATQHSTTGSSPAFLMMGRELQLPLDRLRATPIERPPAREHRRVRDRQRQMKQRFDTSRRVKTPRFAAQDWVRVRRPHRGHKLQSFWSTPMQITDQLGPATFRLSDGSRWHASRLRRVPPPAATGTGVPTARPPVLTGMWDNIDTDFAVAGDPGLPPELPPAPVNQQPMEPAQRLARARSRPAYLKDYLTDF